MLDEIAEGTDIEIVDVMYEKEGDTGIQGLHRLPGRAFIDDCDINETLVVWMIPDPIPHSVLEVSSSGEKPLRENQTISGFAADEYVSTPTCR